jgi:hypothetical protein
MNGSQFRHVSIGFVNPALSESPKMVRRCSVAHFAAEVLATSRARSQPARQAGQHVKCYKTTILSTLVGDSFVNEAQLSFFTSVFLLVLMTGNGMLEKSSRMKTIPTRFDTTTINW